MNVKLMSASKLSNTVIAARTCYNSFSDSRGNYENPTDEITNEDLDLLTRLLFKNKHESVFEHLVYTFKIEGIPRFTLQELARHRIASYSVKSTRYCTSKELRNEKPFTADESDLEDIIERAKKYLHFSNNPTVDMINIVQLELLRKAIEKGIKSDDAKPLIPESFKTDLVWTVNLRSLRNFLKLRLSKSAHPEIRKMAELVLNEIPEKHRFLVEDLEK